MTINKAEKNKKTPNEHPFVAFSEDGLIKAQITFAKLIFDQVQGMTMKMIAEGPDYDGVHDDFSMVLNGIISGIKFLGNERHALIKAGEVEEDIYSDEDMESVDHLIELYNGKMVEFDEILIKLKAVMHEDENGNMIPKFSTDVFKSKDSSKEKSDE